MRPRDYFGGKKLPQLPGGDGCGLERRLDSHQLTLDPEHDTRSRGDLARGQLDIGRFGSGIGGRNRPGETFEFDESDRLLWHATW